MRLFISRFPRDSNYLRVRFRFNLIIPLQLKVCSSHFNFLFLVFLTTLDAFFSPPRFFSMGPMIVEDRSPYPAQEASFFAHYRQTLAVFGTIAL